MKFVNSVSKYHKILLRYELCISYLTMPHKASQYFVVKTNKHLSLFMNGLIMSLGWPHLGLVMCMQSALGQEDNSADIGWVLYLLDGWLEPGWSRIASALLHNDSSFIWLAHACLCSGWWVQESEQLFLPLQPCPPSNTHTHMYTHAPTHSHAYWKLGRLE